MQLKIQMVDILLLSLYKISQFTVIYIADNNKLVVERELAMCAWVRVSTMKTSIALIHNKRHQILLKNTIITKLKYTCVWCSSIYI